MTDFSSEQYKRVVEANNRRTEISGEVNTKWTPLDECVHTQLYKAQAELIEQWVDKEEKRRPPPLAPLSPFNN
jgi:vacuolar-type H+-ATPase subunit B/Vma2